jgi:hypothetical protein
VSAPVYPPVKPNRRNGSGQFAGKTDWKAFFKKTIVIVFLFSLAVHVLLLIGFGGVTLFKGRIGGVPFSAESLPSETAQTPLAPPEEDMVQEEKSEDTNLMDEAPATEESAPPLEMMTVPGGASWAPAVPKDIKMPATGNFGGSSAGIGAGTAMSRTAGVKLFGVEVKAKKLGVIVSINKGAQNSGRLPGIFEEIFKLFPDSPVFLTNGGGMRDWDVVESEHNKEVEANNEKKKAGKPYDKFMPKEIKRPEVGRFNAGAALDWVVIRGFKPDPEYAGLKEKHPELFEDLRRRPNVWFISSDKEADGAYLAFSELLKKGVEAVYWYNKFDRPIEGKESERIAQQVKDSKIEILIQNEGKEDDKKLLKKAEWLRKVDAKFVK